MLRKVLGAKVITSTYVTALPSRYTDWVAGSSTGRAKGAYHSSKISGPNLRANRTNTQWFPGVKLTMRGANNSPPSSAEFRNDWSYTSTIPISLHGVHRGKIPFAYTALLLEINRSCMRQKLKFLVR
jgi:hypothetical protein